MQLTGNHSFNASAQTIWNMLMDADTLARVTPGISRLERDGEDKYRAIADIKMGPVSGSFSGEVFVLDKVEPGSFLLRVKQNSRIGNVAADVHIRITPVSEAESELSFEGEAKLSGLLARTGQRVLGGVAQVLTRQFFEALEKEVQAQPSSSQTS